MGTYNVHGDRQNQLNARCLRISFSVPHGWRVLFEQNRACDGTWVTRFKVATKQQSMSWGHTLLIYFITRRTTINSEVNYRLLKKTEESHPVPTEFWSCASAR
ncbi:hypothetical protein TNCT_723011 [Trichonephila clavata]|uniref:Uncharacterized protein n=1 Tax=Trichonephila clavata TaxID=2740835 RepID=A0A8X6L2U6_TRICU|nr:hypothetical protein TNCT_723011 [Trichonephila clavata]